MCLGWACDQSIALGSIPLENIPCLRGSLQGPRAHIFRPKTASKGGSKGFKHLRNRYSSTKIMPRRPMCTSAACGGSDMRKNAAAATPTAPPACPPLPACTGGSGGAWSRVWGCVGAHKVARGGALVGACWCWCWCCCGPSAAPLAPAARRTCPRAACSCCEVWCGLIAAGGGPASFVGAVVGLCMGICDGGCDGACGGVMGFTWATGRGAWLWRW